MKRIIGALALIVAVSFVANGAFAQHNPCNPCGGKAAMNPCNPCGGAAHAVKMPAVNPCHAKMGTVFYVADPMMRNSVSFTSQAPLEDITGTTNQIVGYVVFDPRHPEKGGRGMLAVPTGSLETGIPLRNTHLQGAAWLDAKAYPQIEFRLDEVKDVKLVKEKKGNKTFEAKAKGKLLLHGKTKKIEFPVRITYLPQSEITKQKMPGDLLAGRASFQVELADFGVKGMGNVVGNKVAETIQIDVSFIGTDQMKGGMMNACNPCDGKMKGKKAKNPCGGKAR